MVVGGMHVVAPWRMQDRLPNLMVVVVVWQKRLSSLTGRWKAMRGPRRVGWCGTWWLASTAAAALCRTACSSLQPWPSSYPSRRTQRENIKRTDGTALISGALVSGQRHGSKAAHTHTQAKQSSTATYYGCSTATGHCDTHAHRCGCTYP